MKNVLLFAFCFTVLVGCKKEKSMETPAVTSSETKVQPVEFADSKYTVMGKKSLEDLTKGDMDSWMSNYADNANYYWNSGDSLVGKPAIDKYWRNRRADVIESITFENDIWLPTKVNSLQNVKKSGIWLLSWYKTTAKYKGGKSMTQWIHTLYHFNENDKIDEVNQYLDRAVINEAMKK